jgi:hypothetical protein
MLVRPGHKGGRGVSARSFLDLRQAALEVFEPLANMPPPRLRCAVSALQLTQPQLDHPGQTGAMIDQVLKIIEAPVEPIEALVDLIETHRMIYERCMDFPRLGEDEFVKLICHFARHLSSCQATSPRAEEVMANR